MNLNHLSIKKKLILAMISAVLFSTTLVGILSQQQARKVIETRLLESEIPATLLQIRNQIDKEVSLLQAAAQQLATNPLVIDSLTATLPQDNTQIVTLLNEIKQQYHLFDASIADRNTGNYWNQDGFLRQLNHQQDSWFYNFVRSGNAKMLNVFREANGDVKLFVNYQQLNGKGLAGLSKSLDEMVQFINQFKLEQTGFVYLVDDKGIVRIHHDNQLMGKAIWW